EGERFEQAGSGHAGSLRWGLLTAEPCCFLLFRRGHSRCFGPPCKQEAAGIPKSHITSRFPCGKITFTVDLRLIFSQWRLSDKNDYNACNVIYITHDAVPVMVPLAIAPVSPPQRTGTAFFCEVDRSQDAWRRDGWVRVVPYGGGRACGM